MSNVISGLIVVAVAGLIGAVGLFVRVRVFPGKEDEEREDVAGYVTMMVGVMFALILALALVSVWEDKDSAQGHVATEASSLNETYLLGASMLPADQAKIQAAASAYAGYVVHTEFPAMRSGKEIGDTGWQLLTDLRTSFLSADVSTPGAPSRPVGRDDANQQPGRRPPWTPGRRGQTHAVGAVDRARPGRSADRGADLHLRHRTTLHPCRHGDGTGRADRVRADPDLQPGQSLQPGHRSRCGAVHQRYFP